MEIPFTQFLMPDGRQTQVTINRPDAIATLARGLIDQGCRFEIEMLQTGEISMECLRGKRILASELCPNGPPVPLAVDKMIQEAVANL